MCYVGPKGRRIHIREPERRRTNFYWTSVAKGGGPSEGIMFVSDEVAALRRELEKAKREVGAIKAKTRECEAEIERLRRERSWGTSFDRQGGGNSADRRGTSASTMGPMWTRGVNAPGGLTLLGLHVCLLIISLIIFF